MVQWMPTMAANAHESPGGGAAAEPDVALALVIASWTELKSHFERRSRELNEEVRNYPTPIARCDVQLSELLEQRDRVNSQLRQMAVADPAQPRVGARQWLEAVDSFLAGPEAIADDKKEIAIRARLQAAASRARGQRR